MSSEWPRIAVCFLTDANSPTRTEYALMSVRSVSENLIYPNLAWYLALDGTEEGHLTALRNALEQRGARIFGWQAARLGPGPTWNQAVKAALDQCDFVFWLENDWTLPKPLDVTPYVKLLMERDEVGMVRLGLLPVNLNLYSIGHNGIHYLRVLKTSQYAYSGNPSIRHRRYFDAYQQWYPKDGTKNPGECEIWHDARVRDTEGPDIWWPVDLGGWGIFQHIGTEQSY